MRRLYWLEGEGGYYPFHLLDRKAQLLTAIGEWQQAEAIFRDMLGTLARFDNADMTATVKNQLGFLLARSGKNQEALELLDQVYRYDLEKGDAIQICRPLVNMGNAFKNIGEFVKAREHYQKAIDAATVCGDRKTLAMSYSNLALLQWMQGENEQAMENLKLSMAEAEATGDLQQKSIIQSTMGNIFYVARRYDQALKCYWEQMAIARTMGDKHSLRVALNNLGGIHDVKGEYQKEIECFLQSLELAREMGDKAGERLVLGNLGVVSMHYGNLKVAEGHLLRSLALAQEIGDKRGLGISLFNLGLLYRLKGDHRAAIGEYDKALPILQELRVKDFLSNCLYRRAEADFLLGRYQEAQEWAIQAVRIAEESGHGEEGGLAMVLIIEIKVRLGSLSINEAEGNLQRIAVEIGEEEVRAEAWRTLYRLTASPEYRERARAVLVEMISRIPRFELKQKLEEIT